MTPTETEQRHDAEAEDALHADLKDLRKQVWKYEAFIRDAAAFIRYGRNFGMSKDLMLTTLTHDLNGLAEKETCFLPRVNGYHLREGAL